MRKSIAEKYSRRSSLKRQGFTLIETLLYLSIISLMVGTIAAFYFLMQQVSIKAKVVTEVESQGDFALDYLTREIQNANSITSPGLATNGTSLTISCPDITRNPVVVSLAGDRLQIIEAGGTPEFLTSERVRVDNIAFSNLSYGTDPEVIRIEMTLSYKSDSNRNEYQYQSVFNTTAMVRQ